MRSHRIVQSHAISFETPEGVVLQFELASIARRAFAFGVDIVIIGGMLLGAIIVGLVLSIESKSSWFIAAFLLTSFLLRNFYFVFGEIRGRGQTWGKRLAGVRVIDSHGRPLSANAIFLRNVTRDMELFLPIIAIFYPEAIVANAPWWGGFISLFWGVAIGLVPFFHPKKQRVGDLIAGTNVVIEPVADLLDDVGERATSSIAFTKEQLDMYGIYELQVLENIIRDAVNEDAIFRISEKIVHKIAWADKSWVDHPRTFLDSFYVALRGRLEHRMLLGDKQERKREGTLDSNS